MIERPIQSEQPTRQELSVGKEFSPFKAMILPEDVDLNVMEDPKWPDAYSHDWPDLPQDLVPRFDFIIEGVNGSIFLFGDSDQIEEGALLPLGQVRRTDMYISNVDPEGRSEKTKEITKEIPLFFGVRMDVTSVDELEKIKPLKLQVRFGDITYNLTTFGIDISLYEDDYFEGQPITPDDKFYAYRTSKDWAQDQLVLPYDKALIDTVRATFLREESPQVQ